MKYIQLTGKIISGLIAAALIFLLTAAFFMQDKVSEMILSSLNKSFAVKIETRSMKLSFLRKFPKASLELRNVLVHSSIGFNRKSFGKADTDTLFYASSLFMEFSLKDIIRGYYNIETLSARSGRLNLLTDSAGGINYVLARNEGNAESTTTIDLKGVNLHDIRAGYNDLSSGFMITGVIRDGKLRSRISGDDIDLTAAGETEIGSISLSSLIFNHKIPAKLDLVLESRKDGVRIRKGNVIINDYSFNIDGMAGSDDVLDLSIKCENIDPGGILQYLPESFSSIASAYNPSGRMVIDGTVKGPFSGDLSPDVELGFSISDGGISAYSSKLKMTGLAFDGWFSNGSRNCTETSSFTFNGLKFRLGSSDYNGFLKITGLNKPLTEISLKGRMLPSEIRDFFGLEKVTTAGGAVDLDLKLVTGLWPGDSITINDLLKLRPEGSLDFSSFSFGMKEKDFLVSNINGKLLISDAWRPADLNFNYKGQIIRISGEFRNLPEWLSGRPVRMVAKADVYFSSFRPAVFLNEDKKEGAAGPSKGFPDMELDINFRADSLDYRSFTSSDVSGTLSYRPKTLTFKSLSMKSLEGSLEGDGFIVQNNGGTYISKGDFDVKNIDVQKAFATFRNFGQSFILAENISGKLSGSISMLLPMNSEFTPDPARISAEGKYILTDGALIDFEPVKQLSSFIELSELQNIHFQKLENDFFIRNNVLYVPQMEVRSSAADLTVNGQHSFGNDYEYHIKMLLSQLLSKKRKAKSSVTEFGVVKDDGLGRTSILLKVEDKGDDVKVGYDIKAAASGIKNNIKQERQALKTILNEEYGQNKTVQAETQKPAAKKSKVSITWDDNP